MLAAARLEAVEAELAHTRRAAAELAHARRAAAEQLAQAKESVAAAQVAIAEAGGHASLIAMLRHGTPGGKEAAAGALRNLINHANNQSAIAQVGGLEPLIALLRDSTPGAKGAAAGALRNLAVSNACDHPNKGADGTPAAKKKAKLALATLTLKGNIQAEAQRLGY